MSVCLSVLSVSICVLVGWGWAGFCLCLCLSFHLPACLLCSILTTRQCVCVSLSAYLRSAQTKAPPKRPNRNLRPGPRSGQVRFSWESF